ncbi:MAG TPA: hypothetical protein VFW11_21920 [Cyclobacteriaceae bacterium]|nr:hypothetical protein [Cyclobacteriaceae bacterium]
MEKKKIILIVSLFNLMIFFSCHQKIENRDNQETTEPLTPVTEVEPDSDLEKALQAFVEKHYKESDQYIRNAAKSMQSIASISTGEQKTEIERSIGELNDLAGRVALDRVDGINELNYFFSRAGHALAGYKVFITESYFNSHLPKEAAKALRKAINQMEANLKYHSREKNQDEIKVLEDAKLLAGKIEREDKISDEEVRKNLDSLKAQIKKWNEEFAVRKH